MFFYLAYSLTIQSSLPLPELIPIDSKTADVNIQLGHINNRPDTSKPLTCSYIDAHTILLWSQEVGKFVIKDGRQIIVDPCSGANEALLQHFITGPALALLLYQRGYLVLHASAVSIGGSAVAFLGKSGRGKSTTAAALHSAGHNVIADDELAVQTFQAQHPIVFPSFPQLKLWPEGVTSLGEAPEALPLAHFTFDKRKLHLEKGFAPAPIPLKYIYVLTNSERIKIERLSPQESIIELVRHTYGTRLIHKSKDKNHLSKCVNLARKTTVARLKRPRSLAELPDLVKSIEQDVSSHESS